VARFAAAAGPVACLWRGMRAAQASHAWLLRLVGVSGPLTHAFAHASMCAHPRDCVHRSPPPCTTRTAPHHTALLSTRAARAAAATPRTTSRPVAGHVWRRARGGRAPVARRRGGWQAPRGAQGSRVAWVHGRAAAASSSGPAYREGRLTRRQDMHPEQQRRRRPWRKCGGGGAQPAAAAPVL
jgi:hypothetical protein